MKNTRILNALWGRDVDCTPVWIMRQAGRYLPEYREIRTKVGGFMDLCKNPDLACEVTLQPLRRYNLDAAILFSDILTIPDAMGMGLSFNIGQGPIFSKTISNMKDVIELPIPDPEIELQYVNNAIRKIKLELNDSVPLIGFSGSPWTIATYMVEGKGSKDFHKIRKMLYAAPDILSALLEKLTTSIKLYLEAQLLNGADVLMLFDSWGGIHSHTTYGQFSLKYMQEIIAYLKNKYEVPIILFTKGGGPWLEAISNSGCNAAGIDWSISLAEAKSKVANRIALQGNLDPAVLYASDCEIEREVARVIAEYGDGYGHIFNLGHGIYPDVDPDKLSVLVDAVRKYGRKL